MAQLTRDAATLKGQQFAYFCSRSSMLGIVLTDMKSFDRSYE